MLSVLTPSPWKYVRKRSLLSRCPTYIANRGSDFSQIGDGFSLTMYVIRADSKSMEVCYVRVQMSALSQEL
jgi:hypothetical protein